MRRHAQTGRGHALAKGRGARTRAHGEASTRRVGLGLNDGGWCPTCKGEAYFMAKWRGVSGNYASECKQCGERRLFEGTDLIGAIQSLMANGGAVTRRAWTMRPTPLRAALWRWRREMTEAVGFHGATPAIPCKARAEKGDTHT